MEPLISPSPIFLEQGCNAQRPSLNMFPSPKIEACFPLAHLPAPLPSPPFTIYIHGSWSMDKWYEIKNELLFRNALRNTLGTGKINKDHPPPHPPSILFVTIFHPWLWVYTGFVCWTSHSCAKIAHCKREIELENWSTFLVCCNHVAGTYQAEEFKVPCPLQLWISPILSTCEFSLLPWNNGLILLCWNMLVRNWSKFPYQWRAVMKNNCIVLVSMPIMRYAPGLTQLEALKNKEIRAIPLCKGKARVGGIL